MSETPSHHKLTTILYADVAEYSRLTGEDEIGSHRRVMQVLDLASEHITGADGKVLRYAGDAILAEFSSVVNAVQTAITIQQALHARNLDTPELDPVRIRIGINLGEVLEDRGEIFGDGVNAAARLEAHARPGGICFSSLVHDQIRAKMKQTFEDGGEQSFKNIARPIQVYHWHPEPETQAPSPVSGSSNDKPSIAVLAFENMSHDPEQDFFAEGISEDIITELSKFRSFFVIARNSSFSFKNQATEVREISRKLGARYIVEGSVRKAGNRIRITAQLIDADSDKHLWAEKYDRDLEDIFAVQDEVTQAIVSTIEPRLIDTERQLARSKPTENLNAWENYQRGLWHIYQYTRDDTIKALEFQQRAIDLDPNYASAHAGIAFSLYVYMIMGCSQNREADLQRGLDAGNKATRLDPDDPFAHVGLGRIQIVRAEHQLAIAAFDRALELNPGYALAHYGKAHCLWHCGDPEGSVAHHDQAMRISPRDPLSWTFLASKAIALTLLRRFDEALECSRKAQQFPMTAIWAYMGELCSLGLTDRPDEAREALDRALVREPRLSIEFVEKALPITHAPHHELFYSGLRKAGVPETSPE